MQVREERFFWNIKTFGCKWREIDDWAKRVYLSQKKSQFARNLSFSLLLLIVFVSLPQEGSVILIMDSFVDVFA